MMKFTLAKPHMPQGQKKDIAQKPAVFSTKREESTKKIFRKYFSVCKRFRETEFLCLFGFATFVA